MGSLFMAQPTKRRAHGEDAIYWDESKGRWYGSVSLGFDSGGKRLRRKVSGKTKTEVKDKLRELHSDLDAGVKTSASHTVDQAVADWMREGRDGRSARTLRRDELILRPVLASIGGIPLHALRTHDVRACCRSWPRLDRALRWRSCITAWSGPSAMRSPGTVSGATWPRWSSLRRVRAAGAHPGP